MSSLTELREKVERASGPSRELDAEIMAACFDWAQIGSPYLAPHCVGDEPIYWHAPAPYYKQPVPPLSASIDAALALVERKLPGWGWEVRTSSHRLGFTSLLFDLKRQQFGDGRSAPLAILSAFLRALESQEQAGG